MSLDRPHRFILRLFLSRFDDRDREAMLDTSRSDV